MLEFTHLEGADFVLSTGHKKKNNLCGFVCLPSNIISSSIHIVGFAKLISHLFPECLA